MSRGAVTITQAPTAVHAHMILTRRSIVLAVAGSAALVAGVVLFVRTRPSNAQAERRAELARYSADLVDRGQAAYRKLDATSFAEFQSLEDLKRTVSNATFMSRPSAGESARERLVQLIAEFVHMRFVVGDLTAYKAWRRAQHARLIPIDELRSVWLVGRMHERMLGEPLPDGIGSEALFDKMWAVGSQRDRKGLWPIGIVTDPDGLVIAFGPFDARDPTNRPRLQSAIPNELWLGGHAVAAGQWWMIAGAEQGGRVPQRMQRTECAEVGMILTYPDGTRKPLALAFLWDPSRRDWSLIWLCLYNYPPDGQPFVVY